jgi:cytochrome c556
MRTSRIIGKLGIGALCAAVLLAPAIGAAEERDVGAEAINARQGFMDVVVWEAGPLFSMAKGEMPYSDAIAAGHAANLKALSQYGFPGLFLAGTSKADRPGKTRALADIWADPAKFQKAYDDWGAAVAKLAEEAGNGKEALGAAVGALGKACGGCHKPFRAKDF